MCVHPKNGTYALTEKSLFYVTEIRSSQPDFWEFARSAIELEIAHASVWRELRKQGNRRANAKFINNSGIAAKKQHLTVPL